MNLEFFLRAVAAIQAGIAILNLFIVRILKWKSDLERMPLLIREVFQVHAWFISLTLMIFAAMTWRFALEMANGSNPACLWLAGCIGIFWLVRAFLQVTYYSSSHWKGQMGRTLIHIGCLLVYGGMALIYLIVAGRGGFP